jgi:hypothetical protein
MVKESYFGQISIYFKDIGLRIKSMVKEGLYFRMETIMKDNLMKEKCMVMENM